MKKLITILLALVMCVAVFAACGEGEKAEAEDSAITVVINNGTRETKAEYKKGDVIEEPKTPNRNGYTFEGWFIGEEQVTFPYTVSKSVTIEAKLTAEPAAPVVLAYQPISSDVARGEKMGPWFEIEETRGYQYKYQWYVNTTNSNQGGTLIEGANDLTCAVPSLNYNVGDKIYVYCEVVGTRTSTGVSATTVTEPAEVNILEGGSNILFVGAAHFEWRSIGNDSIRYLDAMLKSTGYEYGFDKIVAEGSTYNIWEAGLTGLDQEKVKNLMQMKYYDYIVLQLGRDYVLTTPGTRDKEIQSVINIMNYVKTYNPECKVILYQPAWRPNESSSYWERYRSEGGFSTVDDIKAAIRSYVADYIMPVASGALVADLTTGFEKAIAAGINPYGTGSNGQDFPNADGGYLGACTIYSLITGKSAEGIAVYTTGNQSSVTPENAATLQKIAAELAIK